MLKKPELSDGFSGKRFGGGGQYLFLFLPFFKLLQVLVVAHGLFIAACRSPWFLVEACGLLSSCGPWAPERGWGAGAVIGCDSDLVVLRYVGSYSPLRDGT